MLIMTMISYIVLEGVRSSMRVCVFRHKFYIQFALPISPEIMDRFWCSRCLNNRIEVPDIMRLFAGGATTPWWWKFELNNPRWKLKICPTLIAISHYLEPKFDYSYFIYFLLWFVTSTQKISSHFNQKWRRDSHFPKFWFHFESVKSTPCLHYGFKWLDFFV